MNVLMCFFQFSPERFKNPLVIIGLVMMFVGLIFTLASGKIFDAIEKKKKEKCEKAGKDYQKKDNSIFIKLIGAGIAVAGALMAVFAIS